MDSTLNYAPVIVLAVLDLPGKHTMAGAFLF